MSGVDEWGARLEQSDEEVVAELAGAARRAYRALADGADVDGTYAALTVIFEGRGLDRNAAESAVDWCEGGTLVDDLTDAVARR